MENNVFYPIWHLFFIIKCPLKCCLEFVSIWTSLKLCRSVESYGLNVEQMTEFIMRGVENIVRKGENTAFSQSFMIVESKECLVLDYARKKL